MHKMNKVKDISEVVPRNIVNCRCLSNIPVIKTDKGIDSYLIKYLASECLHATNID